MGTISTIRQAENAKPGRHKVSDSKGLYLSVAANGRASWFFRYDAGEKNAKGNPIRREMGLGSRDSVTLEEARQKARKLAANLDDGQDPLAARQQTRAAAKAEAEAAKAAAGIAARRITFRHAASGFLEAYGPVWKHKYARANWRNTIARYAFPVLGDMTLESIGPLDIARVMTTAVDAGNTETARRLRSEIFKVIEWARALGRFDTDRLNPANAYTMRHAKPMRRRGEREHYDTVPLKKAQTVFQQLVDRSSADIAFAAWVFMIATATRGSEAIKATWSEIDLDGKLWTIPAKRMKKNRTHVAPLNSIALDILAKQAKIRRNDFIFPGVIAASLSYAAFAGAPRDADIDAATPHGWRSVFRDWAGDHCTIENKGELAEFALAHVLGQTEGAYRRSTGDRGAMMEAYAQWLLSKGADVIPFPARVG